ncbi:MAG: hypothetical protein AAGA60_27070 [Cyanobacteria bacterium P01_E01_bin.42]
MAEVTAYLQIMWVETVVCGSVADNVVSFANNVGLRGFLFADNVVRKMPCLWVGAFMFAGRYNYQGDRALTLAAGESNSPAAG